MRGWVKGKPHVRSGIYSQIFTLFCNQQGRNAARVLTFACQAFFGVSFLKLTCMLDLHILCILNGYLVRLSPMILNLYAVKAQTSLAPLSRFRGSRVTTAHAHQCCIFQSYAKTVPSRMKLTMREPTFMGSMTTDTT